MAALFRSTARYSIYRAGDLVAQDLLLEDAIEFALTQTAHPHDVFFIVDAGGQAVRLVAGGVVWLPDGYDEYPDADEQMEERYRDSAEDIPY